MPSSNFKLFTYKNEMEAKFTYTINLSKMTKKAFKLKEMIYLKQSELLVLIINSKL